MGGEVFASSPTDRFGWDGTRLVARRQKHGRKAPSGWASGRQMQHGRAEPPSLAASANASS